MTEWVSGAWCRPGHRGQVRTRKRERGGLGVGRELRLLTSRENASGTLITATIETDAVTLHDYLRVVRRRKWLVVLAALLLSLAALAFSLHQQRLYEASADVLLNSQNAAATLPGAPSMGLSEDPERVTQTQAHVARKPEVVERAASGQRHRPERQRFPG